MMDPDIREAIAEVRADVRADIRDGFTEAYKRMDQMVTQGELRATVARMEAADKNTLDQHRLLAQDFSRHLDQTREIIDQTRAADAQVAAEAQAQNDKLAAEFRQGMAGISATAKWAVGIASGFLLTAGGTVIALLQYVRTLPY